MQAKKREATFKPVRKDEVEAEVSEVIESFLDDTEALASLAVDLADAYRASKGRRDELLRSYEAQRKDVEKELANFIKAIGAGIFNDLTATRMAELEQQKKDLDAQIQVEQVKAAVMENEGSIGTFYRRYAKAKLDDKTTREQLLEYFVDKIYAGENRVTVASWFYDGGDPITWEEFTEATGRSHAERLVRVFNMGPQGGGGGN